MNTLLRRLRSVRKRRREMRELAPARTAIVSFPKSGRTWLRMLIGKALCDRYDLPASQMLETLALTRAAGLAPTVFHHDGGSNTEGRHWKRLGRTKREFADKRVLFLIRDPRDVVVSCFFEASKRKRVYAGSISEFLRDPHYGIEKIVTYDNLWHAARGVPEAFELVSYEGLHADPRGTLARTLAFLGATGIDDALLDAAVEFSRFENMRRMEEKGTFDANSRLRPGDAGDRESFKTRKGAVGGYAEYLGGEDLAYANEVMERLGCPLLDEARGAQ